MPGLSLGEHCPPTASHLQVKMPSKKFAHIPVYTLGFESPQGAATAKPNVTQRREVFQCVPLLCWHCVVRHCGNAGVGVGCVVC